MLVVMGTTHQLARWAKREKKTIAWIAGEARCTEPHLRNILAGRKSASLRLAQSLSKVTRGAVPMDAFLRPSGGVPR